MSNTELVTQPTLTLAQLLDLAEVQPEIEWSANLRTPNTRRAYRLDVTEFIAFAGIEYSNKKRRGEFLSPLFSIMMLIRRVTREIGTINGGGSEKEN